MTGSPVGEAHPRALSALGRTAVTLACLALLGWNAALVLVMERGLVRSDFGKLHASARAYLAGRDMYDLGPATLSPVRGMSGDILHYIQFLNLNPPHFHLILLPLAPLPGRWALVVWGIVSLACLGLSLHLIAREAGVVLTPWRRRLVVLGLLSFAGFGAVAVTGQVSFVLLLPMTLAWIRARRGSWAEAGVYLGLVMSVKPFLGIFLPYLVLRRRLDALGATLGAAAGAFLLGLGIFGWDAHRSWIAGLSAVTWEWVAMNASLLGFLKRVLAPSAYYAPLFDAPGLIGPIWLLLSAAVGVVSLTIAATDSSARTVDRGFAVLLFAALLISPLGWTYYWWLALGPMVALVAAWNPLAQGTTLSSTARWRRALLLVAVPGLLWPLPATVAFQPNPWATALTGSAYFWATLALWAALIADWRLAGGRVGALVARERRQLRDAA
ncbi:MAG TPA: glycosyltransferase family 87 protein [Methylomirabilota bacterium]|nr:glycosyltransferase family 87 protein [Methylomirabilota bacterium]